MYCFISSRNVIIVAMLLGIIHFVYPIRPSVLLKRSLLRRRLLTMPGLFRPKRQLFREDIPHHRPLTGNTYYLHAGFPHPSRWYDGPQVIPPNHNAITHHHLHEKPGLHDDNPDNNNHGHNNNHVNNENQNQLIHPNPPYQYFHQQHQQHHQQNHYQHHQQNDYRYHYNNGLHEPVSISVVNNKTPNTVNIHSDIVHANGVSGGGVVDNSLSNPIPHFPVSPHNQANFDPLISPLTSSGPIETTSGHFHQKKPAKPPKPHSEPEPYEDDFTNTAGDYGLKDTSFGLQKPPEAVDNGAKHNQPERKPKTIIHYHPVTVGNIINFNDDNKPVAVNPNPNSYGPPDHVPGIPLANKDVMMAIAEPFIRSPFKTVNGPPDFLDFTKENHNNNVQYGPPQHVPGVPIGSLDLSPMLPSFGPPVKTDTEPPYGVALPVIAHLHSGPPRHHPPKYHRGKGRSYHQHHLHLHHIHHPPLPVHAPPVEHPSYIVHGQVPQKYGSFHNPRFRSHSHHHHKAFWNW